VLRRHPHEALIFDTETLDEPGQRLLVGVWRFYRDDPDTPAGHTCMEEGLFYPDELPDRDPDGWVLLQSYAQHHSAQVSAGFDRELKLWPVSRWLKDRLYTYGYRHRNRCSVVGFNLPFDLGAMAAYYAPSRGEEERGGWSLGFWGRYQHGDWDDQLQHPRLRMRALDPRRTLISWGLPRRDDPDGWPMGGRFVDLRTLTFALTDKSLTLEGACKTFGDPFEKAEVAYGVLTEQLLDYALEDIAHTALLYRHCLEELDRHPGVDLKPYGLYSPAGVGAAYLTAMGVQPPLEKYRPQGTPDAATLGWAMSAFYGGRAEARIVRVPLPVVVTDFTSMYPAQNELLGTWPLLTAARLVCEDVTPAVQRLIKDPDLVERLFAPATWARDIGVTFVELCDFDGAVLPVRAGYEPSRAGGDGPHPGTFNIGINPLHYDGTLWYALPDVLAAVLLGPPAFTVRRAVRLQPRGRQAGLRTVQLRGGPDVDPATTNPFLAMIEARHRALKDPDLPKVERDRVELFLKITANASAYGSLARLDRRDLPEPRPVTAYGPMSEPVEADTATPEDPGPFCFPPVAASITAGARLMLALLERILSDAGGGYVFMDTDSAAIVATPAGGRVACPGEADGMLTALSHDQVRNLLRRFTPLNPFGREVTNSDPQLRDCPWKIEHKSADRNVHCYAIAAKRYILFQPAQEGPPTLIHVTDGDEADAADAEIAPGEGSDLVDWSEHGLGLYLDPLKPERPDRDAKERRRWIRQAWEHILATALGTPTQRPAWASQYALTRFTASSPAQLAWFNAPDHGPLVGEVPRPASFGLLAQADPILYGTDRPLPAAPYSNKPREWPGLPWVDRRTRQSLTLATAQPDDPERFASQLAGGAVRVRSLGDILTRYPRRPEHKSLAPDGTPSDETTVGKLRRRPVHSAPALTRLIGKESNKLLERLTGEAIDPREWLDDYGSVASVWDTLVLPALRQIGATEVARVLDVTPHSVRRWLNAGARPHAGSSRHAQMAVELASSTARERLAGMSLVPPADPYACLALSATLTENSSKGRWKPRGSLT
jgi:hypothetical protein